MESFVVKLLPPLGQSDHNLISLASRYSPVPITPKTARVVG